MMKYMLYYAHENIGSRYLIITLPTRPKPTSLVHMPDRKSETKCSTV